MIAAKRRRRAGASRRPAPAARDTDASPFAVILEDLIARVPGALGAVLVDGEGEAVDYAGRLDPFDLKLAGAHWQLVLANLAAQAALPALAPLGTPRRVVVRGVSRSFILQPLPEGYILVLVLGRRAGFTVANRAFAVCTRALEAEAGWRTKPTIASWFALQVEATRTGSPSRLRHGTQRKSVEILGRVAPLGPRERGWRVRLDNGAEVTLIREPGTHWYADEPIESLFTPSSTIAPAPTPPTPAATARSAPRR